jgi:UDP-galactopyranose mutase
MYDYLIVGAGLYGSICAEHLVRKGNRVLVIDKRNHIGGNCYSKRRDGIDVHMYGPHIFHTNDEEVWNWLTSKVEMNNFSLRPVANYKGQLFSLPFNMWTFNQIWGVTTPDEAKEKIEASRVKSNKPTNLEEQAISLVGYDVYNKLIKGYTEKQWQRSAYLLDLHTIIIILTIDFKVSL